MAKPYALSLYSRALEAAPRFEASLTKDAKGWKRSTRSMGGSWQGSFSVEGDAATLQGHFRRWLAYDLRERAGGMMSWRGMVYEMDLTLNGITRRRSLDLMVNRDKATYLDMGFVGENFANNPSFEDRDVIAGIVDDFYGWEENPDGGSIKSAGLAHTGAFCVAMSGSGTAYDVWIRQNVNVTPGASYQLKFWTKGDAGNAGAFGVRQPNAPTYWIISQQSTYVGNAVWTEYTVEFSGPSEGEIILFFYAPPGGVAFFDDIEVLEKQETVYETAWAHVRGTGAISEEAILDGPAVTYGVREEVIHLDGYPEDTSIAYRNTHLVRNAYPWPRPVSATKKGEARLDVKVAGYIFTMNWLYVMHGDGLEHDLSDWLSLMVGTHTGLAQFHGGTLTDSGDCQWVRNGIIRNNTLQIPQLTGVEERPWDVIQELVELGDANAAPYRAWIGTDRLFNYAPIVIPPRYFIRKDGIYDTMASNIPSNSWLMQPAVFRDMTYKPPATEPGSFLQSAQDMYVEEVEMADGWDAPALKTVVFSEAEILLAQHERGIT